MEWHLERYRLAARCHPHPEKVADLGCGLGLGIPILESIATSILAADINPDVIRYLEESQPRSKVTYSAFDIHDGPLPGAPYDLVCLFEVIEHLENPAIALESLKASLRQGGVLILSTPNSADGDKGTHPYHVSQFSQDGLERLLQSFFQKVTIFSQGPITKRRLMARRKDESTVVRIVRHFDPFQIRRWLPRSLRGHLIRQVTDISEFDLRKEVTTIVPERDKRSRWTIAVCAIDEHMPSELIDLTPSPAQSE